ncbi:MAG: superoxide dismutase family protein [Pseudomonadota bacterium]
MKRISGGLLSIGLAACGGSGGETSPSVNLPEARRQMTAEIIGVSGEVIGEAVLSESVHGMMFRLHAHGLPEGWHGAHLHTVGDCSDFSDGFKAAGGHVNITGDEHGLLNPKGFHLGANFPNLFVSSEGALRVEVFSQDLILEEANDEDGFTFIIHINEDDHMSQPIGGAGGRIACAAFNPS